MTVTDSASINCCGGADAYADADPRVRRMLDQALFDRILILDGEVSGSEFKVGFAQLFDPEFMKDPGVNGPTEPTGQSKDRPWRP